MWRTSLQVGAAWVVAGLSLLAIPGAAWAGGPGLWTMLGTSDNGGDSFGVLRTADQNLHVVWLAKRASNTTQSYDAATVSVAGKVLNSSTALSGWATLAPDPRLVADGSDIRLIFNGNTDATGCYADGEIFTETSTNGSTWNLVNGSATQRVGSRSRPPDHPLRMMRASGADSRFDCRRSTA